MSKHQMIEQIRQRNRSVSDEFLMSFDEQTLGKYLNRLTHIAGQRGRRSVWVRDTSCAAVTHRACA